MSALIRGFALVRTTNASPRRMVSHLHFSASVESSFKLKRTENKVLSLVKQGDLQTRSLSAKITSAQPEVDANKLLLIKVKEIRKKPHEQWSDEDHQILGQAESFLGTIIQESRQHQEVVQKVEDWKKSRKNLD